MKKFILLILFIIAVSGCMTSKIGRDETKSVGEVYHEQLPHAGKVWIGCLGKVHSVCGTGSGTLFYTPLSKKYYVITNAHVLNDAESGLMTDHAMLELDDNTRLKLKPLIIGQSGTSNDIGIAEVVDVKFGSLHNIALLISPSKLMKSLPREDQRLVVIGAPKGVKSVLSTGHIYGLYVPFYGFLHTAETQPGSSGSIVYTMNGRIAGITWGKYTNGDFSVAIAAPASNIQSMLSVLGLL